MARNYALGQPVGNNNVPEYLCPPAIKAVARYVDENGTASSVISLSDNTTAIEIGTGGTAAVMRWVPVTETAAVSPFASVIAIAGTTANFDHEIPANAVRRFVVPQEVAANQGYSSMVGTNRAEGLYQRVAIKTQGIASVLLTEYGSSNSY